MPQSTVAGKFPAGGGGGSNSPSNSGGDDMGSTSTASVELDLSCENEKLKKDNEKLCCELARAKKQCDELVAFLRDTLKVGPDQIDRIIRQGTCGSTLDDAVRFDNDNDVDDDENAVGEDGSVVGGESLKLFGVWLKGEEGKKEKLKIGAANKGNCCHKRGRQDQMGLGGPSAKVLKTVV